MKRYLIGFAAWLACVSIGGFAMGQQARSGVDSGETRRSQTCCAIADLIRASARRHHVEPMRALALAWRESRHTNPPAKWERGRRTCGVMQLNERWFPGACEMTIQQNIDAGIAHFAKLIQRYGEAAERHYLRGY